MKLIFFLIPLIAITIIPVFADEVYRGNNYEYVDYENQKQIWRYGLSQYLETNNTDEQGRKIYVHYLVDEQPTYIKVETGYASFIFDKSTCSAKIYEGKLIFDSNNFILGSDSYVPKSSVDGSGIWNIVNSVNNASCIVDVIETSDSIEVSGTKSSSAGIFKVRYLKIDGQPLKTILEATNLSSLTDRRFGVTQTQEAPRIIEWGNSQIDLGNHVGQTFERVWLENNKAHLLKFSNKLSFNVIDAWDNLESVTINSVDGNRASISFNYLRNTPILLPNQTLIIDPTYSFLSNSDVSIRDSDNDNVCEDTGSTTYTAFDDLAEFFLAYVYPTTGTADCQRSFIEFEILETNSTWIVQSVNLLFDVENTGSVRVIDVYSMDTQPSTRTTAQQFDEIDDGTLLIDDSSAFGSTGNSQTVSLGSLGVSTLQTAVNSNQTWYALGFRTSDETLDGSHHFIDIAPIDEGTATPPPTLEVTYYSLCNEPLSPTAKTQNTTSILLTWSQPDPSCSPTGYKIFQSENNADYTLIATLGNVTSSYINSLDTGTMFSYKILGINTVGDGNSNSTIVTNSTLPIAPSLSALPISKTQINVEYSDGSQPNVLWFKSRYAVFPSGTWIEHTSNSTVNTPRFENFTSLTPEIKYNLSIASGTLGGFGDWSNNATARTYTTTSGTLSFIDTNVGDIFLLNGTLSSVILSPSPQQVTTIRVYDNGTLIKTITPNDSITEGSNSLTFVPIQIDDDLIHEIILNVIATNDTGTVTINSTAQYLTREYDPDYIDAVTPSEGTVYWIATRESGEITLTINRDKNAEPFQVECAIYTTDQARLGENGVPTWINQTNIYFFIGSVDTGSSQTLYYRCYNDPLLFQGFISANGTDALIGGFESLDSSIGNWMGVPIVTLFILFLASMATKTNSGITIIALLIAIGIMGGIGLFTMDAGLWALMMIMGTLAIIGAKLGFD